jgi:hypothetical protein
MATSSHSLTAESDIQALKMPHLFGIHSIIVKLRIGFKQKTTSWLSLGIHSE